MKYKFIKNKNSVVYTTERHSRSKIAYYSKKKMNELYPDGGYEVIGEIGNLAKRYPELDEIYTDAGISIPIFPRGKLKKPFEHITGYAAVGENTYVAVIKSIFPLLF